MKFAILGAGGIGGYVGGRLLEAGHEVTLLARGRHLQALQNEGLRIESPDGDAMLGAVRATDDIEAIGPVDIVLATVKLPDLAPLAAKLPALLTPSSRVVTLQNGIDAKPILSRHVDPAVIAPGVIYLAAYIKQPGVIMTPGGKHEMLVDALNGDATMTAFFAAIAEAKAIDATPTQDGARTLWEKFAAQCSIAAVTAITRMSLGGVFGSAEATALLRQLLGEAIAVAKSEGVTLDDGYAARAMDLYSRQPAAQSSSLLVDLLAGKQTELAWLSGRLHELGAQNGVETPGHSLVWRALAAYRDGRPEHAL